MSPEPTPAKPLLPILFRLRVAGRV